MPFPLSERASTDGKQKAELVQKIHHKARKNIEEKTKKYVEQANKGRRDIVFDVGDEVWVHLRKERFPAERKSKLIPRIDGPFTITKRINNNSYQLDLRGKYNISPSFNISDLSPFLADETDLKTNPFQEGGDDMTMDEVMNKGHEPEHGTKEGELVSDEQLVAEEMLPGPMGPMTRSRTKSINQAIGLILRCLGQDETKVTGTSRPGRAWPRTAVTRFAPSSRPNLPA